MNKGYLVNILLWILFTGTFLGCRHAPVEMPEELRGRWKSKLHRPDIILDSDSAGNFAIVYHRTCDGDICPLRYPLYLSSENTGIIQAEGRIMLYYNHSNHSLFLSPGGDYRQ